MMGFRGKRQMAEVRWLGPYAPEERHADNETLNHIIALRKMLAMAEQQRDNALDAAVAAIHKERVFRYALNEIQAASTDDLIKRLVTKTFETVNDL